MSHQFQVVTAAVLNDNPQELLGTVVPSAANVVRSGAVPYSISPELIGSIDNQHMFSISPQPGTVIPISAYHPQQLLVVGDGLQQQGLCAIAMAPSDASGQQGAQFVHQPQVQQLVFEAQPQTENGFYVNTLPLTGTSWVYSDPKQQAILPTSNNSLLQSLLEQPQNSLSPALNHSYDPGTKELLVMLQNGEQRLIKFEVQNKAPSQVPENILPTIDQNVEGMFVKQMTQQDQCVPVIKKEAFTNDVMNGEKPPSSPSDIMVLKELKPPSAEYVKRDPLEQSEPASPSATQMGEDVFLLNSKIRARFRTVRSKLIGEDNLELSVVEDKKFPESQEVPKYLEIMAVCTHCGYTSMDFNRCQRCKRKLPARVKTVPVSKNTTAEVKPVKAAVSNPERKIRRCDCGSVPTSDDRNRCGEKKASKVTRSEQPTPTPPPQSSSYLKADVIKMAARDDLEAMAVCSYCGYTSVDTELCERSTSNHLGVLGI
ncbi:uncharacterized protein [Anabrus simplex]|uniref:uncharacterized protein isoform X2 n=1 Tax=Anabrus simplex TaxID=316456 RepID=UPI0035A371BB